MNSREPDVRNEWIAVTRPILLSALGWMTCGAISAWVFFVVYGIVEDVPWLPQTRLGQASIIALLFGLFGLFSRWRQVRQERRSRSLARSLGLDFSLTASNEQESHLREMFSPEAILSFSNVGQKSNGNARFLVADMVHRTNYRHKSHKTTQTIAYYEREGMDFPAFTMRPGGGLVSWFSSLVGLEEIDLKEHPEFSKNYRITAEQVEPTQRLFSRDICDYFENRTDYEIRGEKNRLVWFQRARRYSPDELGEFVQQALEVFTMFEESSSQLGAAMDAPPIRDAQQVSGDDNRPHGGSSRATRANQLETEHVWQFLDMPTPRTLPPIIERLHLGHRTWIVVAMSGILGLVGVSLMLSAILLLNDRPWGEEERLGRMIFGAGLALLSSLAAIGSWTNRRYKRRILQYGVATTGRILSVKPRQHNDRQRYDVSIEYAVSGEMRRTIYSLHGPHVKLAQRACHAGRDIRLLYDVDNCRRILPDVALVSSIEFC